MCSSRGFCGGLAGKFPYYSVRRRKARGGACATTAELPFAAKHTPSSFKTPYRQCGCHMPTTTAALGSEAHTVVFVIGQYVPRSRRTPRGLAYWFIPASHAKIAKRGLLILLLRYARDRGPMGFIA